MHDAHDPHTPHDSHDPDGAPEAPAGSVAPAPRVRASGPTRAGLVGWWSLLALVTVGIFFLQKMGSAPPEGVPDPANVSSLQLKLTGRLAVGMDVLTGMGGASSTSGSLAGTNAEQFEEQIRAGIPESVDDMTPAGFIERIRAATIMGELSGAEGALAWLEEASADLEAVADAGKFDFVDGESDLDAFRADIAALRTVYEAPEEMASSEARGALPGIDTLRARHSWYTDLALTHGLDDSDPLRESMQSRSFLSLMAATIGILGIIGLFLVGLVAFPVSMVFIGKGKIRSHYEAARAEFPAPHSSFLGVMALFLAGFIGVSLLAGVIAGAGGPDVTFGLIWILPLIAFFPLVAGFSWRQVKAGNGWTTGRNLFVEIGAGIAGYVTLMPIVAMGLGLTLLLFAIFDTTSSHPVQEQLEFSSTWGMLKVFLLAAVWAPLTEETVFRGAFYHHLRQRMGFLIPTLVSSFLFAFIHPQGILGVPVLMALGVNFALLREWRGSIVAPIVAHALHNGCIVGGLMLIVA